MNTVRWILGVAWAGCFAGSANAQVLTLTGHVTEVRGSYLGSYNVGERVKFTFDFSADYANGTVAPAQSLFESQSVLTIGGRDILSLTPFGKLPITFFDKPSYEGLYFAGAWGGLPDGGELRQQLLSTADILPSSTKFPAGIPLDEFFSTAGSFSDYTVINNSDIVYTGQVLWEITDYTGQLGAQLPATPEPSTYGLFGALGLAGLVAYRRSRQKFQRAHHRSQS